LRIVGLSEAKQKLSELVERAREGERIGITRRGKLAAMIVAVRPEARLQQAFEEIEQVRKRARPRKSISTRDMVEEGRI
jgi:prevent-host-death family protein